MTTIAPIPEKHQIRDKIICALQMTGYDYENLKFIGFQNWCNEISAKFFIPVADLVKNDSLWNYYQLQWEILVEKLFYNDYHDYLTANFWQDNIGQNWNESETFLDFFMDKIEHLWHYYPASIINKINPKKVLK